MSERIVCFLRSIDEWEVIPSLDIGLCTLTTGCRLRRTLNGSEGTKAMKDLPITSPYRPANLSPFRPWFEATRLRLYVAFRGSMGPRYLRIRMAHYRYRQKPIFSFVGDEDSPDCCTPPRKVRFHHQPLRKCFRSRCRNDSSLWRLQVTDGG
jgi:hypothetical protein